MAKTQTEFTINGTDYSTLITYRDAHGSYWQSASGHRTDEGIPVMETEAYYGEEHVDGMDTMPLDTLIEQYGPIVDADPDLEGRTNEVTRSIRSYRDSIRNCPATLSARRASMLIGRLQAAVETLAETANLNPHAPEGDD
ncbi:hypothetical protein [Streptomyces sp. NBC_00847]|uniref:hypothetical protein n=1 Tax=Streptomyces sp. NBC_00847 TaxID=2975850 RepID=UPI00225E380D|nr:hypothetical protein [Streptomyces sp. NBC_00847]MCX4885842.1 hypothetical protein [Streptomyces sp. NBC_00847]